jgi:hypothetical protein
VLWKIWGVGNIGDAHSSNARGEDKQRKTFSWQAAPTVKWHGNSISSSSSAAILAITQQFQFN